MALGSAAMVGMSAASGVTLTCLLALSTRWRLGVVVLVSSRPGGGPGRSGV
jgi:hypothetical protein